jgi:hypothetical protein
VTQALATDLGLNDLDTTLFTSDAAVLHALILSAQAFIVLDWTKDPGTEEAVSLRLERPVVNGLGLLDLAMRPAANLLGRSQADANRDVVQRVLRLVEEIVDVLHCTRSFKEGDDLQRPPGRKRKLKRGFGATDRGISPA